MARDQACTPSELKKPSLSQTATHIVSTLHYSGFVSAMDAANTKLIDRPMMEGEWFRLVKSKVKPGEMTALEVKAAFNQVKGDKSFDVEKYWTSKKFKAMFDHSIDLNIKADQTPPTTAEGHAQGYADIIGAHPEQSLRTRK